MDYVYIKDNEGFVVKKKKSEILPHETIITEEEYAELSGDNYYKTTFSHGGKHEGAKRTPKTGVVFEFQVKLSAKEKEFINWARSHNLNYDEIMEG